MPLFTWQEKFLQLETVTGYKPAADGAGTELTVALARQLIHIDSYLIDYKRMHCRHKVTFFSPSGIAA